LSQPEEKNTRLSRLAVGLSLGNAILTQMLSKE
jgi:hypothetical protein